MMENLERAERSMQSLCAWSILQLLWKMGCTNPQMTLRVAHSNKDALENRGCASCLVLQLLVRRYSGQTSCFFHSWTYLATGSSKVPFFHSFLAFPEAAEEIHDCCFRSLAAWGAAPITGTCFFSPHNGVSWPATEASRNLSLASKIELWAHLRARICPCLFFQKSLCPSLWMVVLYCCQNPLCFCAKTHSVIDFLHLGYILQLSPCACLASMANPKWLLNYACIAVVLHQQNE